MTYGVRLYINSGFNSVNIPDNPSLLDGQNNFIDVPALDILQDRNLSVIRVKALWDNIKDTDYLRLSKIGSQETWYYSVDDIVMENTDTASLSVTPDYINSIGGVMNIQILDGITERVHVSDDGFGLYEDTDPLLEPKEPLEITTEFRDFNSTSGNVVIESTVNPVVTLQASKSNKFDYTDPVTGDTTSVNVPVLAYNERITSYKIPAIDPQSTKVTDRGTTLYLFSGGFTALQSIALLRSLGVEQCIVSQVLYPFSMVEIDNQPFTSQEFTDLNGNAIPYTYIQYATGKKIVDTPDNSKFDFEWKNTVKNKLVEYSQYCKYGIITTAGNTLEAKAKDIIKPNLTRPMLVCISDPNPDGKPYFRFNVMNGDESDAGFWRNCVAGMSWKQVPLMFTGKSGSLLDTMHVRTSIGEIGRNVQMQQLQGVSGFANGLFGGILSALAGIPKEYFGVNDGSISPLTKASVIGKGINTGLASGGVSNALLAKSFGDIEKAKTLSDYKYETDIVTPTVNFPYNSDIIRDYMGNGVMAYRYTYSDADIERIDKLLTMYGYKHTKMLETSDFNNRQYFNYVKCNDITVTGNARYINDGIAEQLNGGVRIWHVKPNKTYYNNNPIRNNS